MDDYKITFKCRKEPQIGLGLDGFRRDTQYTGRSYNGWFEVSPEWGRGRPTKMLDKNIFDEYFELLEIN